MPDTLCLSVTFLDPRFHGRGDGGTPEWPPSPLRLFQAIVAANGERLGDASGTAEALRWLERQPPPTIVCPAAVSAEYGLPVYVPNNASDLTAKAAARGKGSLLGPLDLSAHRTLKLVRPTHLTNGQTVHYLWPDAPEDLPLDALAEAVGRLVALGWGIDLAVAQARRITADAALEGERWRPMPGGGIPGTIPGAGGQGLRWAVPGTLAELGQRHQRFLHRLDGSSFQPVPPLKTFSVVGYRRDGEPSPRPFRVFELRRVDGERYAYSPQRLIHLAGALRHRALEATKHALPPGVPARWRETFVAGHRHDDGTPHRQISYLPLPSIGHRHTNPAVRRIALAAAPGDEAWLTWIADRLAGQSLEPDPRYPKTFGLDDDGQPISPLLIPVASDAVIERYTRPQREWASVTPVVLPGHHNRRAVKTRRLIDKALAHAGISQPCTYRWQNTSRFPKSLPAAAPPGKRRRRERTQAADATLSGRKLRGYLRPDHLLHQSSVHLELTFTRDLPPAGPLAVGSGRHCGLGLFAQPL